MLLRRSSSIQAAAQQEAARRAVLQPGQSFDMVSRQVLDGPQQLVNKRRTMTMGERLERIASKLGWIKHMDGPWYQDTRSPFTAADIPAVTLLSTDLALYPVSNFPVLGSNYWGFIGKKLVIELFGRITTAATPGNGNFDIYWGTGAAANGTILASSAVTALAANQSNLSWYLKLLITQRAFGSGGALLCTGYAIFNSAIWSVTTNVPVPQMIPASAPAQVAVDLTAANIISVQYKRSGSTAETMQVHDGVVTALN